MSARHIHAEEMLGLGRRLWGEPNRECSTRTDIRFGSQGSKSIDLGKGEWYDFEALKGRCWGRGLIEANRLIPLTRPGPPTAPRPTLQPPWLSP
jgi:hypothetical protein